MIERRLGADHGKQGQPERVGQQEQAGGQAHSTGKDESANAGKQRGDQIALVGNPEDGTVEEDVAQRAAAQRRGERDHDHAEQVEAFAAGLQHARGGVDHRTGEREAVEQGVHREHSGGA